MLVGSLVWALLPHTGARYYTHIHTTRNTIDLQINIYNNLQMLLRSLTLIHSHTSSPPSPPIVLVVVVLVQVLLSSD